MNFCSYFYSHANKNPFALVAAAHLRCGCNLRTSKGTLALVKSGGSKWRPEAKANKNKNPKLTSEGSEGRGSEGRGGEGRGGLEIIHLNFVFLIVNRKNN
jgi:hypothetical protein